MVTRYQALQFNLAEACAGLKAAKLLNLKAATLYDNGADTAEVGNEANMPVLLRYPANGIELYQRACTGHAKILRFLKRNS